MALSRSAGPTQQPAPTRSLAGAARGLATALAHGARHQPSRGFSLGHAEPRHPKTLQAAGVQACWRGAGRDPAGLAGPPAAPTAAQALDAQRLSPRASQKATTGSLGHRDNSGS